MSFLNKVVLVTGAASGMGEEIAINFSKLSAAVSIIDVNADRLDKCAAQCRKLNGGKVLKHVIDLRDDNLVKKVIDETVKEFQTIDIVVNCAGIFGDLSYGILDPKAMEKYDSVFAVNLRAMIRVTNCVAPVLITNKGCVVNIASVAAKFNTSETFAYNISKSAVKHFTKCVALELAPHGVRVNAILPGAVKTNILYNSGATVKENNFIYESALRKTPLKRFVETKEVADMVVYLASESAKNITGADFVIDGGISLSNCQINKD